MRSLRRAMGAGEGNKLAKLASISGALIAGCVAPRKPAGEGGEAVGRSEEPFASASSSASASASTPPSSAEMTWPPSAPTASATAAKEAAALAATGRTSGEDAVPSWSRDLAADLALDLDDAADDAAIFSALEGEAAQEVLKLQEELSVIQAAEERRERGRERRRRVEDAGGAGDEVDLGVDGNATSPPTRETLHSARKKSYQYPSSDEEELLFEEEDEAEGRAPLPEPLATKDDPAALLGPGAPAEAMAAAAELAVTEALERARDETGRDDETETEISAVDLATLAERVAVGKGGSNWGPDAAGPSSPSSGAGAGAVGATSPEAAGTRTHDDSAFKVKLYPAGRILHMVVSPPVEDVARAEDGDGVVEGETATGSGSDASRRRYEMYADVDVAAYDRIRLSKTMLSDHFLPKYLEALEDVREGLKQRGARSERASECASARVRE